MNQTKEKVIFRQDLTEGEYYESGSYLAAFPEEETNPGTILAVNFMFQNGKPIFCPFYELSLEYYYNKTRIIHKTAKESETLLKAIEEHCDQEFKQVEKIMN